MGACSSSDGVKIYVPQAHLIYVLIQGLSVNQHSNIVLGSVWLALPLLTYTGMIRPKVVVFSAV